MAATPQELADFLAWRPLPLVPATEDLVPSLEKRRAAFYDKHLNPNFVLRRIRYDPQLLSRLTSVVDEAIGSAESLPAWSLSSPNTRQIIIKRARQRMYDKSMLINYYLAVIADEVPSIASTLVLHPTSSTWDGLLQWREALDPRRLADAYLEWTNPSIDSEESLATWDEMPPTVRQLAERLRQLAPVLIPWEFKTLGSGSQWLKTAVKAVLADPERPFNWRFCSSRSDSAEPKPRPHSKSTPADASSGSWLPDFGARANAPFIDFGEEAGTEADDGDYDLGGKLYPGRLFQQVDTSHCLEAPLI